MHHILEKISAAVVAAVFSIPAFAQGGSDALPFTRIGRDVRLSGMAGASFTSSSQVAYSAFSNAAVLPFFEGSMDGAVSYQNWAPDGACGTNLNAGIAFRFGGFGLSLGAVSQMGEAYSVIGADGAAGKVFTPKDLILSAGMGFRIGESFSLGLNARFAKQTLAEGVSYNGFSGDLYALYRLSPAFDLTAGISTLGTKVKSASGKEFSQPASARFGATYRLSLAEEHAIEANLGADYYFSGNYGVAVGAEYGWKGMVFARAGYRMASKEAVIPSHAGIGLGAKWNGIRLDVSFLTASKALGNTLAVGLGYSF